jgi:hypothetical protein
VKEIFELSTLNPLRSFFLLRNRDKSAILSYRNPAWPKLNFGAIKTWVAGEPGVSESMNEKSGERIVTARLKKIDICNDEWPPPFALLGVAASCRGCLKSRTKTKSLAFCRRKMLLKRPKRPAFGYRFALLTQIRDFLDSPLDICGSDQNHEYLLRKAQRQEECLYRLKMCLLQPFLPLSWQYFRSSYSNQNFVILKGTFKLIPIHRRFCLCFF